MLFRHLDKIAGQGNEDFGTMRGGDGCGVLKVRKPRPDKAACQKDRWIGQFIFSKCLMGLSDI